MLGDRRTAWLRLTAALGIVLLAVWAISGASASADSTAQVKEYEVKAGYLYSIAKFVDWPADAFPDEQAPFIVAVLGEDPFGSALDAIQDRQIQNRRVLVKRSRSISELAGCHILFVSASEADRLDATLAALEGPILTVSDIDGFSARGGCIGLVRLETKLGLEANIEAAHRARLSLSSKMLQLAKIVKDRGR